MKSLRTRLAGAKLSDSGPDIGTLLFLLGMFIDLCFMDKGGNLQTVFFLVGPAWMLFCMGVGIYEVYCVSTVRRRS
jgi:hypothetical protein